MNRSKAGSLDFLAVKRGRMARLLSNLASLEAAADEWLLRMGVMASTCRSFNRSAWIEIRAI